VEIYSLAGERESQELLNHLEQFRYTFGTLLGSPDAGSVFPIRILFVRDARQTAEYGTPGPLVLKREAWMAVTAARAQPSPELLSSLGRILLESNAGRMPPDIESGLVALFSTLDVKATHVTLGAPPASKTRDWARMHLLSVDERYSGKLRVLVGNLQRGADREPAFRNAFERSASEIEKELDSYAQSASFGTTMLNARALDARREFPGRQAAPEQAQAMLADLRFERTTRDHPLIVKAGNDAKALESLATQFPKWGEPLVRLAQLQADPKRKVEFLVKAASLEPRNTAYWQTLAREQTAQNQFGAAAKSWAAAERAATTDQERDAIRGMQRKIVEQRLEFEAAERRRKAEEEAREIARLKDEAENRIREAEARANKGRGALAPGAKVEQWWEGPQAPGKARGTLEKVDCLKGMARLVIRGEDGKLLQLLIRNPGQIVIQGGGEKTLGCGVQTPPRKISVDYFPKPDKAMATTGEAALLEFQ
jgi:hypothetical protein